MGHGHLLLTLLASSTKRQHALLVFQARGPLFQNEFVPKALPALSEKLAALPYQAYLARSTMESLENMLEPLIFSGASDIRRKSELVPAVLNLLNMLVDAGSSQPLRCVMISLPR